MLTGVIVAKIDYFSLPFRKSKRQLMKNWEGYAQRAVFNKNSTSEENKNKCTMTVIQKGMKITGNMSVEVKKDTSSCTWYSYTINGRLDEEYLHCDLIPTDPHIKMTRKALFYIHTSGQKMNGVFIGNRSSKERVILGKYTLESRQ